MAEKYDIIVIGGGPGGYVAAIRAAQLGKKTAVVEMNELGGVCLNWGCIPTKALLHAAELYEDIKGAADFGISVGEVDFAWEKVIKRSRDVAGRLSSGISHLFKKYGVEYLAGKGTITRPDEVQVTPRDSEPYKLQADNIIVATGARSRIVPGLEPDGERIITSREAMVLKEVPERLVVVGAGAIGVEFAYLYNAFGSQVTMVEMLPAILPGADADISKELTRQFKKRKIKTLFDCRVESFDKNDDGVTVHLSGGKVPQVEADMVLLAMGVVSNMENIGLEEIGVEVDGGAIKVDEYYRTSIPGVLAIGDVVGPPWLAHAASAEGICAVEKLAGLEPEPIDYGNIPHCTYCEPQVASVGLTEEQAKDAGYELKIGKFPFRAIGKAVAIGKIDGFAKMIYDAKYGELLGAHLIGPNATDLISEVALGRKLEGTFNEVMKTVHPHPTLSEALMEATALAFGESTNY